ncbi:MAG: hypothetical protein ACKVQU_36795 [Burkholderiales bacterium]
MRIILDGLRTYWTPLTSETLDLPIANVSTLEVLIYSDEEFEFGLSDITIDECKTCKSTDQLDNDLRARVLADIPALADADRIGPLAVARLLTSWASSNVDHGTLGPIVVRNSVRVDVMSPGRMQQELWDPDAGGTFCYGFAVFLSKLLKLYAIESFVIDFGIPEAFLTHVTTIVVLPDGSDRKFYVFDATFDGAILDAAGDYMDIETALASPIPGSGIQFVGFPVLRTMIMPANEIQKIAPSGDSARTASCAPLLGNGELYSCKNVRFDLLSYKDAWAPQLRRHNIDQPDVFMELLRRRVNSISHADNPDSVTRFQDMLRRFEIPH